MNYPSHLPSQESPSPKGHKKKGKATASHRLKSPESPNLLKPVEGRSLTTSETGYAPNVAALLEKSALTYKGRTAYRIERNGKAEDLSFEGVRRQSRRLAAGMRKLGVRHGHRIAIAADNSPEWILSFLASVQLGAIAVPIDPRLTPKELENLIQNSEPTLLFCSGAIRSKIEEAAPALKFSQKIFVLDASADESPQSWEKLLSPDEDLPVIAVLPEDPALIIYTSGTTGNPKGVVLSHGNLTHATKNLMGFLPLFPEERVLFVLPLFHVYCLSTLLIAMGGGATVIFLTQLKGPEIFAALQKNQCTSMVVVPRLLELFQFGIMEKIRQSSPAKQKVFSGFIRTSHALSFLFGSRLKKLLFKEIHRQFGTQFFRFICGGGRLSPEVGQFFRDLGLVIQEGYGLTETVGAVTVAPYSHIRPGTVGKVTPESLIRIDAPNADGIGEILLSGPSIFKGYYRDTASTKEAIQEGWYHTGDLGFLDADGYLTLTGRKKDMIVLSSGKNVYPDEVESFYAASPYIKQIGIIGIDRGKGEEVFACLVPKLESFSSTEKTDRAIIDAKIKSEIARISETISPHKRISQYRIFYQDLPATLIGKVKRNSLRALIAETPEARVRPSPISQPATAAPETGDALTQKIIQLVKGTLSGTLPERIGSDSHLELDLGMDSLARTELVTVLEKAFTISVPDEEVVKVQNVGDIIKIVATYADQNVIEALKAAEPAEEAPRTDSDSIPDRLNFGVKGQETRLHWLEQKTGVSLKHLPHTTVDPETLKGNIEHFIGMAQVPIGIAGPILVDGDHAQGAFYVPLATTEGALVASVTRGMMAITHSGGARVHVLDDQIIRAPMWIFERGRQMEEFMSWMKANFDKIKAAAESTTRSGKLKELEYIPNGRRLTVRFLYTSGDASGQNMVTMATHAACALINKEQPIKGFVRHFLENNLSGDKKMSMVNILSARGKKVYADAVIKKDILRHFLHTTPEEMIAFSKEGALGSMQAGIYGTNAQYANVLAAIFMATGQDVACTHEASTGLTVTDLTPEGDLYISVTLPNLIVATVGGGTGKGTQRECLEILGCFGSGKVNRLAEIIAACVLAGEISISGAHSAGDFAQAHDKLGRNRPTGEKKPMDYTPCKIRQN